MTCREASTGNCCEICQGITSLRYGCTLALSPVSSLAGAVLASSHLFNHYKTIQMKEDIENTSDSSKETRSVFIGAKVTPTQKKHIKSLAGQCGMTVSDYILSRAYNFKPKARLTKKKLLCCRIWTIVGQTS